MGIGGAFAKTSAPALLQETAHPRLRSVMGPMYYGSFFLGSLVSAIFCSMYPRKNGLFSSLTSNLVIGLTIENEWSWRLPCVAAVIGPIFVLLILFNAPESPRYLMNKGKHTEALDILAKYHANGEVNDPLVQWEYQEINQALEAEATLNKSSYVSHHATICSSVTKLMLCSWTSSKQRAIASVFSCP